MWVSLEALPPLLSQGHSHHVSNVQASPDLAQGRARLPMAHDMSHGALGQGGMPLDINDPAFPLPHPLSSLMPGMQGPADLHLQAPAALGHPLLAQHDFAVELEGAHARPAGVYPPHRGMHRGLLGDPRASEAMLMRRQGGSQR